MEAEACWKWASLLAFCLQNSLTPIIFRYASTEATSADRTSTAVILFATETLKFVMSFALLAVESGLSLRRAGGIIWRDWWREPRQSLPLAVPAVVYAMQNALLQWSASHLSAAQWQVTYQGKILVTAAFSVVLLGKQIKRVQWFAITAMGLGIAVVQLSDAKETEQAAMANAAEQNPLQGFVMLVLASCCSGFASVYTERVFKQVGAGAARRKRSVWLQNMQLAGFTMVLTLLSSVVECRLPREGRRPGGGHFLWSLTGRAWALAVNNSIGGLLVALVIKHADNLLRGFASAIAVINAALISVVAFGFVLKPSFSLGSLVVISSALLYGGVLRLPGEWWNSESVVCRATQQKTCSSEACGSELGSPKKAQSPPALRARVAEADPEAAWDTELPRLIGTTPGEVHSPPSCKPGAKVPIR